MNQKERGKMNGIEQIKAERRKLSEKREKAIYRYENGKAREIQPEIDGLDFALSVLDKRKGSEICWDMLRLIEEFGPVSRSIFGMHFIKQWSIRLISKESGYEKNTVKQMIHEIEKRLDEYFK